MPTSRDDRRGSGLLSALIHLLIVALIAWPAALHTGEVIERAQGAGGPGPAGGGGGGHRGTGGVREHVLYVKVVPPPAAHAGCEAPWFRRRWSSRSRNPSFRHHRR